MHAAYIGIDPGLSGAIALVKPDVPYVEVRDMPTLQKANGRNTVDMHALLALLQKWNMLHEIRGVLVEDVGAMPGQAFMFPFGFACGAAQMAVCAVGLPLRLVTPQKWKKHYGLKGGKENKDTSRLTASRLFPSAAHDWARKKDDGRAEAVLLANYGCIT